MFGWTFPFRRRSPLQRIPRTQRRTRLDRGRGQSRTRPGRARTHARLLWLLLGISCAGGLLSCAGDRGLDDVKTRAPVLLISIDTLPADRVGCYGHPSVRTPTLDRLARAGLQVRDAISPAPLTLPSHATILTGLDPPFHGVRENGIFLLEEKFATVAELLAGNTKSAAFVGGFPVAQKFNLDQGFDVYNDDFSPRPGRKQLPERPAEQVFAAAGDWLASAEAGKRPFVWIHLFDPHYAYEPPSPWLEIAATLPGATDYEGEVSYVDHELGRFLRGIEAFGSGHAATLLVTADHGEALGAHKEPTHGIFIYDATQRVPLLASGPDFPVRLETKQRRLVDLAPTILSLYGAEAFAGHAGTTLLEPPRELLAYVETKHTELLRGWSPLHGVRTPHWKYIRAPRPELYDLAVDPEESRNVVDERPEIARDLASRLDEILAASPDARPADIDPETMEQLRSLGYVASIEPGSGANLGTDPKDKIDGAVALFYGEKAYMDGELRAAEKLLQRAVRLDPECKDAHSYLSAVYYNLGRYDLSADYARRALDLVPHLGEGPVYTTLGQALLALNRPREALPHLRAALDSKPDNPKLKELVAEAESRIR
jgi:choline-sulfatase